MRRHLYAAIAVLLAAATGGQMAAASKPTTPVRKAAPAAKSRQAGIPDSEIEKAIRAKFAASKISRHNFQVHVQGGVATIEGQTDVLQHKGTATRLAKNAGAAQVVNRIAVSQAARDKAAGNLAKGRRRVQIKRNETTARGEKRSLQ